MAYRWSLLGSRSLATAHASAGSLAAMACGASAAPQERTTGQSGFASEAPGGASPRAIPAEQQVVDLKH